MKRIFVIDWILIFVFILSATSGFGRDRAWHESSHERWHNWSVFHTLWSVSFLVAIIFHVTTHLGWYKGIIKNGIGRKSKITALLSIVFLLLSVTGIVLLGVTGANSPLGLWHYKMGVIMTVIAIGHIIKRISALLFVPRAGTSHRNHRKTKEFIFLIINYLHISYFLHFCHILPIFRH